MIRESALESLRPGGRGKGNSRGPDTRRHHSPTAGTSYISAEDNCVNNYWQDNLRSLNLSTSWSSFEMTALYIEFSRVFKARKERIEGAILNSSPRHQPSPPNLIIHYWILFPSAYHASFNSNLGSLMLKQDIISWTLYWISKFISTSQVGVNRFSHNI